MKTSDIAISPYPSILLIGDSGTHKTFFEGTCPSPYVFDFDKGVSILRRVEGVEYDTFKDAAVGIKLTPQLKAEGFHEYGTAWIAFVKKLNRIGEAMDKGECPYKTLCLDSVTTMSSAALNYVLKQDAHDDKPPQIQHWGAQIELLKKVFDQLSAWPITIVATAHIQRTTNNITEVIEYLPLVTGKLAGSLPVFFDEVYFTTVSKDGQWTLRTKADALHKQAKSRYGVPDGTETSWQAIEPYILGTKDAYATGVSVAAKKG